MIFLNKKAFLFKNLIVVLWFLTLTNCGPFNWPGAYRPGTENQIRSRELSLNNKNYRTCVFDSFADIVHFQMWHYPPNGYYNNNEREEVVMSQFQLFHTLIDYSKGGRELVFFDEHITSDIYNRQTMEQILSDPDSVKFGLFERIDGSSFFITDLVDSSRNLFPNQNLPAVYEYLNEAQKDFLFDHGAGPTLYYLGIIPKIHKVISSDKLDLINQKIRDESGNIEFNEKTKWYIFGEREDQLKIEVETWRLSNSNPRALVFIAFGANHNLSQEFEAYRFQNSKTAGCLDGWRNQFDNNILSLLN